MMHCSELVSKRFSTSPLRKAVGHKPHYRQKEGVYVLEGCQSWLALPAFLASAAGTLSLQDAIIGTEISKPYNHLENLKTQWTAATNAEPPELTHSAKQRIWDQPLLERVMDEMADSLPSASDQARWRAVTAPHAGDWLLAMPIASCGLKLDDEPVRVAVVLRLRTNLCEPHTCVCGQRVTAQGHHGLSYIKGFGRQARHGVINDVIYQALTKAGYTTVKEPPGLVRSDDKRPDGLTLIP